ncbi:MAG: sulfite exporter TauE/SafE family protein [Planctomycetes bacterium]|nr:sulfite exporter TauE/SafE family protein [Planctomycetota bacterium]
MIGGLDGISYLEGPILAAALLAMGLGLGVLTGLFGVGGGFLIVPLLNVAFGMDYTLAKGSCLACIFGTSASGLMRHLRLGHVAVKTMLIIAGGSVAGAMLGGMLNDYLERVVCGGDQLRFELIMHPTYIALLIVAGWIVLKGPDEATTHNAPLQRLPIGPKIRIQRTGQEGVSLPGLVYVGVGIGILAGLLGVSGVIMMPLLLAVVGMNPRQAIGTSLGIVVFASASGTVEYGLDDKVNLMVAMSILIGSTIGVQFGAWLCAKLHAGSVRGYFVVLVAAVIVMIAVDLAVKIRHYRVRPQPPTPAHPTR